ncbi:hypothetical protein [Salibacterium qingdaonense]|uniref:TIGR04255 family protein n=1 Tax=Salibacterium qingdaonense TaxID=266892 RepID=A0A1I4KPR4_9BACI|nr:hypothetical protein [Salibacterium qingdaonense]SFL80772.1 hypothetical protein SAMN04488054_105152 [Salibacterium qingdaonense]
MLIQTTTFNAFFPKEQGMRRNFINIEDGLKDHFQTPLHLLPIPDDAPPDIPRAQTESHEGHSKLNISLDRLSLQTKYDHRFQSDWYKCKEYLENRIFPLINLMKGYIDNNYSFSGLTTEIFIHDLDEEPVKHLFENFIKIGSNTNPFDVNLKLTYVLRERFYINISFSNVRLYEKTTNREKELPAYLQQKDDVLSVLIDINDRYAHNFQKDYHSDVDVMDEIFTITNDILTGKLDQIIYEGRVEL